MYYQLHVIDIQVKKEMSHFSKVCPKHVLVYTGADSYKLINKCTNVHL